MLLKGNFLFIIGLVLMAFAIVIALITLIVRAAAQRKLSSQLDREYGPQQRKKEG